MKDGKKNGAGVIGGSLHAALPPPPPPPAVAELAEACVRFVERAVGVKLDYEPETLPLLDHYIEGARSVVKEKPEMLSLVAQTSGAYFGEIVRRRHASWWRTEGDDPSEWQIELEPVFLALSPVRLVLAALLRAETESGEGREGREGGEPGEDEEGEGGGDDERAQRDERDEGAQRDEGRDDEGAQRDEGDLAQLTLEEEDRLAVSARLAELPQVSEREFYALSTRLEVIDIAVEAIRARRLAEGEETEAHFTPEDYE